MVLCTPDHTHQHLLPSRVPVRLQQGFGSAALCSLLQGCFHLSHLQLSLDTSGRRGVDGYCEDGFLIARVWALAYGNPHQGLSLLR